MAIAEIDDAENTALNGGYKDLLIFHCVSSYPAPVEVANLKNTISSKKRFGLEIG